MTKIEITLGVLLVALIGIGITILPEDTHYSSCLNITKHCERLSSTGLTCYPHSDTTKGKKYSVCGWDAIINDSVPPAETKAKQYLCSPNGCKVKERYDASN